jgi:hypothetical protein
MTDTLTEPSPAVPDAAPANAALPASAATSAPAPAPVTRHISDVWSRTEPKYRIRAAVLLSANFLLFCGLCVFTHWLHTAQLFDFSWRSYFEPFQFWEQQTLSLNNFLLFPINVVQVPYHGIVLGLLVASIVGIPIAVAILYRWYTALPFAAAVFVFAHMPWMAVTLLLSIVLASVRPFRLSFRYGAALVALLPVILYLYLATRSDQTIAFATPEQHALLVAPWVLAILAASVMLAVILYIASIVRYRPGAVAPVLAAMLIPPTVLFHTKVGVDELDYRVLEAKYGPQSELFKPVVDVQDRIKEMLREYDPQHDEMLQAWRGGLASWRDRAMRRIQLELFQERAAANDACQRFKIAHLTSRYLPNVLYLQACALDVRLDRDSLEGNTVRELYWDFPHPESEVVWRVLWSQYRDSPLAIAAAVRLAQLELRRGAMDQAAERLAGVRPFVSLRTAVDPRQPVPRGLLRPAAPEASLMFDAEPYLAEARRLEELIHQNRDDPRFGNAPLQALATLDPHRADYGNELLRLCERYPGSRLHDNLLVAWAATAATPEQRAAALQWCLRRYPDGDAGPEAMFRLADLEVQTLRADREGGIRRMRTVATTYADTVWGELAAGRLQLLEPASTSNPAVVPPP